MTNIESLASSAKTMRDRRQDTFSRFTDLSDALLDCYFGSSTPEPALGDCPAYTDTELSAVSPDTEGRQVIEYETSLLASDVIRAIKERTQQLKALRSTRKQARRAYFQRLVENTKTEKVFYKKHRVRLYLPAKRRRIVGFPPTRVVRQRVWLKPVTVIKWVIVGLNPDGGFRWATRPVVQPRYKWREFEKTNYKYVTIRPAGWTFRNIRTPELVTVIDWPTVRAKYTEYKTLTTAIYTAQETQLRVELQRLRMKLKERPKLMYTNTTLGAVSLRSGVPDMRLTGSDYPQTTNKDMSATAYGSGRHSRFCVSIQELERYQRMFEGEHDSIAGGGELSYAPPTPHQGTMTMLDSVEQVYQTDADLSTERLAYSSVLSLSKAEDTSFQWFRSLMELKDFKGDLGKLKTGGAAITACLTGKCPWRSIVPKLTALKGLKTTTALKAMIGAYLSWKFAVQPTIQDIETLSEQSLEWVFSIRRSLIALSRNLRDLSNIYHARAKFGASKRILKLGAYHPLPKDLRVISSDLMAIIELPGVLYLPPEATDIQVLSGNPMIPPPQIIGGGGGSRTVDWPWGGLQQYRVTAESRTNPITGRYIDLATPQSRQYYDGNRWVHQDVTWRTHSYVPTYVDASSLIADPDRDLEGSLYMRVFAWNHLSGVIFGAYSLGEVLRLNSELTELIAEVDRLIADGGDLASSLLTTGSMLEKHLDRTFVAWELTPLSFVYDWFTDSHSVVQALSNFVRKNESEEVPEPIHGIWETKRCELLAGIGRYQPKCVRASEYVSEWHAVSYRLHGQVHHWTSAKRIVQRFIREYECTDDKVHLVRSGLYRVRRGENLGYPELLSYAPRIKVKLDAGKLTTLAALLGSFTAPS